MFARRDHAFTLIELLIVVAIIAIIAAIAVPNFLEAQTRAKVSRAKADMRAIATGFEAYSVDTNGRYPRGISTYTADKYAWSWGFVPEELTTPVAYLTTIPLDEFNYYYKISTYGSSQNADYMSPHEPGHPHTRYRTTQREAYIPAAQEQGSFGTEASFRSWYQHYIIGPWGSKDTPFVLVSPGPDKSQDVLPPYWINAPSGFSGAPPIYDPTNGTVSYGDIIYYGSRGIPH